MCWKENNDTKKIFGSNLMLLIIYEFATCFVAESAI